MECPISDNEADALSGSLLDFFPVERIEMGDNECRDRGREGSLIFLFHAQQKIGRMGESRLRRVGCLTQGGICCSS